MIWVALWSWLWLAKCILNSVPIIDRANNSSNNKLALTRAQEMARKPATKKKKRAQLGHNNTGQKQI